MSKTKIEWCDMTINPIIGCTKCSPGCDNCYAEKFAARLAENPKTAERYSFVITDGKWNGKIDIAFKNAFIDLPVIGKSKRVFVGSMGDVFHENVTQDVIDSLLNLASNFPRHTFLLLTKRPERMRDMVTNLGKRWLTNVLSPESIAKASWDAPRWPLPNVWLGVTVCNQDEADEKIPLLLSTPAAKRFVSIEPMLGPINFRWTDWAHRSTGESYRQYLERKGMCDEYEGLRGIDWVILGGETGPKARPMHPDWARLVRDQCQEARVPFFFKSWGEWKNGSDFSDEAKTVLLDGRIIDPGTLKYPLSDKENADAVWMRKVGKVNSGCLLDGREWRENPK